MNAVRTFCGVVSGTFVSTLVAVAIALGAHAAARWASYAPPCQYPLYSAVTADGTVWISCYPNAAVHSPDGRWRTIRGRFPFGGRVIAVSDTTAWFFGIRVASFVNLAGRVLRTMQLPHYDGELPVTMGSDGSVWYEYFQGSRALLGHVDRAGTFRTQSIPGFVSLIRAGPSLWVCAGRDIYRLANSGAMLKWMTTPTSPSAFAVAGDGSIWYATNRSVTHLFRTGNHSSVRLRAGQIDGLLVGPDQNVYAWTTNNHGDVPLARAAASARAGVRWRARARFKGQGNVPSRGVTAVVRVSQSLKATTINVPPPRSSTPGDTLATSGHALWYGTDPVLEMAIP